MRLRIEGIEPNGLYEMSIAVWTNCSYTTASIMAHRNMSECQHAASAVSIFNVEYPSDTPVCPSHEAAIETQPAQSHLNAKQDGRMAGAGKQFVYLVQSDECQDLSHLRSARAEVLQLVWKRPPGAGCEGAIYFPNSTLVQGRNRLYAEARVAFPGSSFTYYIMMDGDVTLKEVRDFGFNTGSAWTTFEEYLLEWEPAVGFPHFGAADYDDESEVQLVFNFDQIVVAYHAEAAPLLLPYTEIFDGVSWWYCGTVQNALCAAVYNNHRMQFNALRALSWFSSTSPTYLRASNFLYPLTWIGPAIKSLDALMAIPWYAPFHLAMPRAWHSASRAWRMRGTPTSKGGTHYDAAGGAAALDYCHEYFRGRGLGSLCDGGDDGDGDGLGATERAVVGGLEELWARATAVRKDLEEGERRDLAGKAAGVADRADMLIGLVSRLASYLPS
jgi:hypothetical protein